MAEEKNVPHERRIKVVSKFQPRSNRQKITIVPEIRLMGKWLRDSGFSEGDQVKVTVSRNQLVLTLNKE